MDNSKVQFSSLKTVSELSWFQSTSQYKQETNSYQNQVELYPHSHNNLPQTQTAMQRTLGKSNFLSQTLKDKNVSVKMKALNLGAGLRFIMKREKLKA